ncbi:hypothetical protein SK128_003536 [Halocaridina rubra]|uniref:Dystroglycan 1 n=1 Tax=Halocaridina rubra TaxID=373956 RepID=A0AAN9A446_HALRR
MRFDRQVFEVMFEHVNGVFGCRTRSTNVFDNQIPRSHVKGLPSWMHWDGHRGVVEGVPRQADRGHHYVTVKATGKDGSTAKDVFSIDVVEVSGSSMSRSLGCRPKDDLSIISVVLDAHLPTLDSKSRVRLLRAAGKFLGVKELSLLSAPHDFDPLADDAAILAGPGSARLRTGGRRSQSMSQLQWLVGCDGEVSKHQQPLVDLTEATAKNGKLEGALGIPVIGWHVTQVNPTSKRIRRQADYSGDYGEYNYDYNYDYGDGEADYLSEYDEPDTRVIPSLLTPVFPEASATYYPGNAALPDHGIDYSPVLRPVPMSTPVYIPVKPTRIIEASPTLTYESAYPTEAYHDLEGSIITQPTTTVESTTPLTHTSTLTKKPTIPTKVIEPTTVPTVAVTTEIAVKNFPPRVKNRIRKLAWIAGHVYHLQIPRDTFEDVEDGDTRSLRLLFKTSDGLTVGRNSWIQFNPTRQEIYALPLEENIGRYTFMLEAMDSEGKTITDSIMIHVQQAREARNYNHRFTATFKLEKTFEYEFVYALDWQIKAVEKIAQAYQETTTDNINVRSITLNPIKLTWTNTSLADSSSTVCPTDDLETLAEVVVSDSGDMTREVKEAFQPEFHLKHIHLRYLGPCERHSRQKPGAPRVPIRPGEDKTDEEDYNTRPIIRNQIDYLDVTQGSLYRFQVPSDTCYDLEDGDSRRLRMRLLMSTNLSPPPRDSWLQFDTANQEFFGIPLANDVGKTEYLLECVDSGGEKITDALFVNVLAKQSKKIPPVEFSMKVDTDYVSFMGDAHQKAKLIERIGTVFGDEDAGHIEIDSLRRGSVIVTWHNGSLPADPCPNEEIMELRKIMVDHNGNLLPEFTEKFAPDFKIVGGSVKSAGSCLGEDTPTHIEEETHDVPVEEGVQGEENDYLLNFIIPAVIIAAMLLLAAIIACCLYRRRRYGKMTMADDRTFVSKGIPIIFAEELDDRPDPAKSPVIMKDEKPPLPPPEYQRGSSPAASSTPPTSDRRRPTSGDTADDTPSYQPPPPFTATNGASRHPRPNMPPTYRKPPTYVPP